MKQLMIRACEENVGSWMNGNFLSYNMLITWSESGYAFLYQLHSQLVNNWMDDLMIRTRIGHNLFIYSSILPGLCETADPRKSEIHYYNCNIIITHFIRYINLWLYLIAYIFTHVTILWSSHTSYPLICHFS